MYAEIENKFFFFFFYLYHYQDISVPLTQGLGIPGYIPEQFVQFAADNVDYNVRSIDGHGTFHGMGIIATPTPGPDVRITINVPRASVTKEQLADVGRFPFNIVVLLVVPCLP